MLATYLQCNIVKTDEVIIIINNFKKRIQLEIDLYDSTIEKRCEVRVKRSNVQIFALQCLGPGLTYGLTPTPILLI